MIDILRALLTCICMILDMLPPQRHLRLEFGAIVMALLVGYSGIRIFPRWRAALSRIALIIIFSIFTERAIPLIVNASRNRAEAQAKRVFATIKPGMPIAAIKRVLPRHVQEVWLGNRATYIFESLAMWRFFRSEPGFTVIVSTDAKVVSASWGVPD